MAIATTSSCTSTNTTMSQENESNHKATNDEDDHEHDVVMPGFRFHPTEEELVEFYLRRKVEGKRFNVELITFLDLYRYDPWELPALAAIGEKEWYFYVPRDRKYRNGDRPNRVTTSGYWKATGADRMIRTENFRSIGLKKTLVFYSGKAPKGIRTSWIMNEYRLPQHDTERYQKAEISLCRVYKRAGVEDHPSLPRSLPSRASSSRGVAHSLPDQRKQQLPDAIEKLQAFGGQPSPPENINETDGSSSSDVTGTVHGLSKRKANYRSMAPITVAASMEEEGLMLSSQPPTSTSTKQTCPLLPATCATLFTGSSSASAPPLPSSNSIDDLHRLVNYQQAHPISGSGIMMSHIGQNNIHHQQQQYYNEHHHHPNQFHPLQPQLQQPPSALNALPNFLPTAFSDRLWEWNPFPEANREYSNPFK